MTTPYAHLVKLYQMMILHNYNKELDQLKVTASKKITLNGEDDDCCMICQDDKDLISFHEKLEIDGKLENLGEMFSSCFNIQIITDDNIGMICKVCVTRLRDALAFKSLIQEADENFHAEDDKIESQSELDDKKNTRIVFNANRKKIPPKLNKDATACPICNEVAISHFYLRRHYMAHFHTHICEVCGKSFQQEKGLQIHMERHTGKRYACSICHKDYISKTSLKCHIASVHDKVKIYVCKHCPEKFSSSTSKLKHMFEKHNVPCRSFPCTQCNRTFYTMQRYNLHVKRMHLRIKEQKCTQCEFSAVTVSELNRHRMTHSNVKNFSCNECGKLFKVEKSLKEHAKIHSNIRNYHCLYCGASFLQKSGLSGHIRSQHRQLMTQQSTHNATLQEHPNTSSSFTKQSRVNVSFIDTPSGILSYIDHSEENEAYEDRVENNFTYVDQSGENFTYVDHSDQNEAYGNQPDENFVIINETGENEAYNTPNNVTYIDESEENVPYIE